MIYFNSYTDNISIQVTISTTERAGKNIIFVGVSGSYYGEYFKKSYDAAQFDAVTKAAKKFAGGYITISEFDTLVNAA